MKTPETSRHFEEWTDPASGVVSYVLKTHVAQQQQTFYFTNRSMTKDGQFLWSHAQDSATLCVSHYKTKGCIKMGLLSLLGVMNFYKFAQDSIAFSHVFI